MIDPGPGEWDCCRKTASKSGDWPKVAAKRHPHLRALTADLDRFGPGVFGVGRRVHDMHRAPFEYGPAGQGAAAQRDRIMRLEFLVFCRNPERGHHAIEAILQSEDKAG